MTVDRLYAEKAGIDPAVAKTAIRIVDKDETMGMVDKMFAMHNLLTAYGYKPVRRPVAVDGGINFVKTTY